MTAADFLSKILPTSLFPDNEILAALGDPKLKEANLPDNLLDKHTGVYMTKDRALNDQDIIGKLKGQHWGHFADDIERKLKPLINALPEEWKTKYYAIPETQTNGIYDRLKVVQDAFTFISEKGSGEDLKSASAKWREKEADLQKQIADSKSALEAAQSSYDQKITDFKIDHILKGKVMGYLPKVDPSFVKSDVQKNFLVDSTINGLRTGFLLEFDKENPENVLFLKKDRTDVYEGNVKVSLDQYLEKQMEPYIVKNNGGATTTTSKTTPTRQQPANPVAPVNDVRSRRLSAVE